MVGTSSTTQSSNSAGNAAANQPTVQADRAVANTHDRRPSRPGAFRVGGGNGNVAANNNNNTEQRRDAQLTQEEEVRVLGNLALLGIPW